VPCVWAAALPQNRQAELLEHLSGLKAIEKVNPEWKQTETFDRASQAAAGDSSVATLAQQWAIASQRALKIGIRADGWYRITQPQIAASGFDVTGDARNLQLFVEGNEVAISVSRDSGPLAQNDFIEFWGQGLD